MTPAGTLPFRQLLRHRLGLARHALRGQGRGRRLAALSLTLAAGLVFYWASWQFFSVLRREESSALADLMLQIGLHTIFFFALLRDAVSVPGHLFRAQDGDLFAAAPLPPSRLLAYRLVEATFDAGAALLPLALPFVLGFALASEHKGGALVAACGSLAGLLVVSVLLISVFALAWPRAWGREGRRRRTALQLTVLLFLLGTLLVLGRGPAPGLDGSQGFVVATLLAAFDSFSPGGWAGRWILAGASGHTPPLSVVASFGLALLGLGAALLRLARRWERARQAVTEGRTTRAGRRRVRRASAASTRTPRQPPRIAGQLFRRDLLLLWREPGMALDITLMAALLGLLPLLWRDTAQIEGAVRWQLAVAGVVAAELAYEVASRSLPLERRATHWLRAAPVSVLSECAARPLLGCAVGGAAGLVVLVLARAFLPGSPSVPGSLLAVWALVPPAALLGWAASLLFAEPEWRHPRQMLRLPGRLLLLGVAGSAGFAAALAVSGRNPSPGSWDPQTVLWLLSGSALAALLIFGLSASLRRSLD